MTAAAAPDRAALLPGIACESDSTETVALSEERSFAYWQQDIPKEYWDLGAPEIIERLRVAATL